MSEYVPLRVVQRLAIRAESDAGLFEDGSPPNRVGLKIAGDIREAIDEHAVSESEVCGDE